MLVGIDRLVAEVSSVLTLHPGDVILTGTPPGIGLQQDPQTFLVEGDVVEITLRKIRRDGLPLPFAPLQEAETEDGKKRRHADPRDGFLAQLHETES